MAEEVRDAWSPIEMPGHRSRWRLGIRSLTRHTLCDLGNTSLKDNSTAVCAHLNVFLPALQNGAKEKFKTHTAHATRHGSVAIS